MYYLYGLSLVIGNVKCYLNSNKRKVIMSEDVLELRIKQLQDWLDSGYMSYEQLFSILGVSNENEEELDYVFS